MQNERFEKIAEAVHNAWWQEKIKQGVTNHPDMLPYNELAEEVKAYDRVTARAVLHNLPEYQTWIPVSERLPNAKEYCKNDGRFIVTDGNKVEQGLFDIYADGYHDPYWPYRRCQPIAWMPLPEPYNPEN